MGGHQGIRSWLVIPLVSGERPIGILTIWSAEPDSFGEEGRELVRTLTHPITLAVEMARLATRREQSAVLEERNRIAREIHDTLAQSFTGIVIQLEAAEDVLTERPVDGRAHISKAQDLARQGLAEARRSVWALRPPSGQRNNLVDTLGNAVRELSETHGTRISFLSEGPVPAIGPEVEFNLLRVTQEAVHNAIRHGRPSEVQLHLKFESRQVLMTVADDGCGFDTAGLTGPGFGLIGMRERVERIGGEFRIRSESGEGTRVTVLVPCGDGGASS